MPPSEACHRLQHCVIVTLRGDHPHLVSSPPSANTLAFVPATLDNNEAAKPAAQEYVFAFAPCHHSLGLPASFAI